MSKSNLEVKEPDGDTVIWRYMSYSRFEQLIESKKLYLARLDQFSDFNEGSMTRKASERNHQAFEDQGAAQLSGIVDWFNQIMNQKYWYASCWNASNYENNLLWRSYGTPKPTDPQKFKVAIKSSVNSLKKAIDDNQLKIGFVRYVDYETEDHYENESSINSESLIYDKQIEYHGENEIRLAFLKTDSMVGGIIADLPTTPAGLSFPVNLNHLIDEIYIEAIPVDWKRTGKNDRRDLDREYMAKLDETLKNRIEMIQNTLKKNKIKSVDITLSKIL